MSKNQLADIFDAVSKQLRNADSDTALKWFNQGRAAAKDFVKAGSETVVDRAGDAKENPLLTAAAVAAVAAAAYQINKKIKERDADRIFDHDR